MEKSFVFKAKSEEDKEAERQAEEDAKAAAKLEEEKKLREQEEAIRKEVNESGLLTFFSTLFKKHHLNQGKVKKKNFSLCNL